MSLPAAVWVRNRNRSCKQRRSRTQHQAPSHHPSLYRFSLPLLLLWVSSRAYSVNRCSRRCCGWVSSAPFCVFVCVPPPQGVLLYGPPGTGKTLLARAVAHHTDCTFIRVSGSELVQKYIGEGSRMVRELFVMARWVVFLLGVGG